MSLCSFIFWALNLVLLGGLCRAYSYVIVDETTILFLEGTHNPLTMALYGRYDLIENGKVEFQKEKVYSAITKRIIRIYVFWPAMPSFYWLKGL
jgi:hypothetical protein